MLAPLPWSMVQYLRPLLDLCMAMVNVDRKMLRPEERKVQQHLTAALAS